jgi:uncharacterized protein YcbX
MIAEQLWQYPVASLGGQPVEHIETGEEGIKGDRDFFVVDLVTGEVAAPERQARWRPALQLRAYRDGSVPVVTSPKSTHPVDDPHLDEVLSEHFGFRCGIRAAGAIIDARGRRIVVGSRYNVSPLHLISLDDVEALQQALPNSDIDIRRFRPNIVMKGGGTDQLIGRATFSIGGLTAAATEPTKRCGMTMIAQPGLGEDPEILRMIVRTRSRCFGVYATVIGAGTISVGDRLLTN